MKQRKTERPPSYTPLFLQGMRADMITCARDAGCNHDFDDTAWEDIFKQIVEQKGGDAVVLAASRKTIFDYFKTLKSVQEIKPEWRVVEPIAPLNIGDINAAVKWLIELPNKARYVQKPAVQISAPVERKAVVTINNKIDLNEKHNVFLKPNIKQALKKLDGEALEKLKDCLAIFFTKKEILESTILSCDLIHKIVHDATAPIASNPVTARAFLSGLKLSDSMIDDIINMNAREKPWLIFAEFYNIHKQKTSRVIPPMRLENLALGNTSPNLEEMEEILKMHTLMQKEIKKLQKTNTVTSTAIVPANG